MDTNSYFEYRPRNIEKFQQCVGRGVTREIALIPLEGNFGITLIW